MSLNSIVFNRNTSGLGTPLTSKDHVSGIVYYNDTPPTGFATNNIIQIFSLSEAEDLGITEDSAVYRVEWYHIREYFEKQPQGELFVGYFEVPAVVGTPDFAEVETLQNFAEGEIRQMGVFYQHSPFVTAFVDSIQAAATTLKSEDKPLNVLFGGDIVGVDLSALVDLRGLTDNNVSVCIGQDGAAKGAALAVLESFSITDLGAKLGAVSFANVHESISWVEKFPMVTDGIEFSVPAFATGDLYKSLSLSAINAIDTKGYLFARNIQGQSGAYHNDSYTAVIESNDLATIEANRTIDKAVRNVQTNVLPKLGSPVYTDSSGKLSADTIGLFTSLTDSPLAQMEAAGELSFFQTIINADQDVVSSSTLVISLELGIVGVARNIVINIGFVLNL